MKTNEEALKEFQQEMAEMLMRHYKRMIAINVQRGRKFKQQQND